VLWLCAAVLLSADGGSAPAPAPFAARAAKVKKGMTQDRVRALLGKPHLSSGSTVWTYHDPPNRPDGPYHWYTFTFENAKVVKVEDGGVACVINE
jgi:hypothetical protein